MIRKSYTISQKFEVATLSSLGLGVAVTTALTLNRLFFLRFIPENETGAVALGLIVSVFLFIGMNYLTYFIIKGLDQKSLLTLLFGFILACVIAGVMVFELQSNNIVMRERKTDKYISDRALLLSQGSNTEDVLRQRRYIETLDSSIIVLENDIKRLNDTGQAWLADRRIKDLSRERGSRDRAEARLERFLKNSQNNVELADSTSKSLSAGSDELMVTLIERFPGSAVVMVMTIISLCLSLRIYQFNISLRHKKETEDVELPEPKVDETVLITAETSNDIHPVTNGQQRARRSRKVNYLTRRQRTSEGRVYDQKTFPRNDRARAKVFTEWLVYLDLATQMKQGVKNDDARYISDLSGMSRKLVSAHMKEVFKERKSANLPRTLEKLLQSAEFLGYLTELEFLKDGNIDFARKIYTCEVQVSQDKKKPKEEEVTS